jgi:hypothetical protein
MGATRGAGTVSPSGVPEFNNVLIEYVFSVEQRYYFFFWPLYCLFLDLRLDYPFGIFELFYCSDRNYFAKDQHFQ